MQHNHETPQLSATTLLILEREGHECQVFVLKRQNRGGFLQDALVFPGGVVGEKDYGTDVDPVRAAAVREIAEETGLQIEIDALHPFSWWLTPECEKRRFDTRFFAAPYPASQIPVINSAESEWGRLLAPSEILTLHEQGEARLVPPTLLTLERICGLITFKDVLSKAHHLHAPICPQLQTNPTGERCLALPEGSGLSRTHFKISNEGRFS